MCIRKPALAGALLIAVSLSLSGCGGVIPSVIPMPASVQSACTLISLAVPAAELFRDNLSVKQQALLTSAEAALKDCAAGNATAAVLDVAAAIENLLYSRGVTKAMLMQHAVHP